MFGVRGPGAPRARRLGPVAAGALALACALAPESVADGNTFSWTKNGNTAITYWRSFKDDAAYMTVTARAHQKVGNRKMYVTIDFYSLRCASGQNRAPRWVPEA